MTRANEGMGHKTSEGRKEVGVRMMRMTAKVMVIVYYCMIELGERPCSLRMFG